MQDHQDRIVTALMEQLIETGPDGMAQAFTALFNLAMRSEREQHLGAGLHERAEGRRGYEYHRRRVMNLHHLLGR